MSRRVPQKQLPPQEPSDEEEEEEEEEEEVDPCEKIQGLPLEQRRRVYALKALVQQTREMKRNKAERMAELQQKFAQQMAPILELRRKIVAGEHEPSAEEIARGEKPDESKVEEIPSDDEEEKKPAAGGKKTAKVVAPDDAKDEEILEAAAASASGGIPHFWVTAFKNHEMLEGMVMERDAEALKYLDNVTSEFVEGNPRKGFVLKFFFRDGNPFFTNKILTKTYTLDEEDDDDYALDNLEGTPIDWTSPANKLTVVIKEKKQRHKSGKGVRVVTREEKAPSFFHFFEPPAMPASDEDEDDEDDEENDAAEAIEMDFEAGRVIHDQLVPRAVHYYTSESIAELARGMFAGGDMGSDEEEEDEEEETDDEEEMPMAKGGARGGRGGGARGGRGGRGGGDAPECKQQ